MIQLDYKSSKPIYEQIVEQMKFDVMKQYLNPGDAIPSVRKLALELKITPGTVSKAYQELERQGVIETIRGKGTFIASKIEMKQDEEKVDRIRQQIRTLIMELRMMGYEKKEIVDMVQDLYGEICSA